MARQKFNTGQEKVKRLSAQDIHRLTQETLQAHFQLEREGCAYGPEAIWDVLLAAAVQQTTVETMCDELEGPSANTVRDALKGILPDEEQIGDLEAVLNEMLVDRLLKQLWAKKLPCAADLVYIPYHGQHEAEDEAIRRGRARSGTTHFHCYATLYAVKNNKRYTLALTFVRRSDTVLAVLQRLLNRVKQLEIRIKRLMLDRGFDNNAIIGYLNEQPFPTILALTIRGKQGGTRALLKGRKSHVTTYTRRSTKYPTETFTVHIACKYGKGRYKRRGLCRFAYIVIGELKMQPLQVYHEYRRRFGIETSYRLMNLVRQLSSHEPGSCAHDFKVTLTTTVLRRSGLDDAQPVGLRQMDLCLSSPARWSIGHSPSSAFGSMAVMALGSGETAPGIEHGNHRPIDRMTAVY